MANDVLLLKFEEEGELDDLPSHPLAGKTLDEIGEFVWQMQSRYPDHMLFLELASSPECFGPQIFWWELRGIPYGQSLSSQERN